MSSPISANIKIIQYKHGLVDVKCTLTNNSSDGYNLLSWHTPLNGSAEFWNMMKVNFQDTKKDIPYDGFNVKRGNPTIDDYVFLSAGSSTEITFSLTESYRIKKTGLYDITLNTKILDAAKDPIIVPRAKQDYQSIDLKSNTVVVDLDEKSPPTLAENYRTDMKLASQTKVGSTTSASHAKLKPASFTARSSNTVRRKQVTEAHKAAYVWAKAAALALSDNAHFAQWFGMFDESKQKTLIMDYMQIVQQMETKSVVYNFNDNLDAYGQVVGEGPTWNGIVELGKSFWLKKTKPLGFDSHAGTIIHELSHVVDRTYDLSPYWYSPQGSEELANISSEYSIMHADSLEYFAETIFPFKNQWLQGSQIMKIGNGKPADYMASIDEIIPTSKNLSSANNMRFSAKDGKFQMVVTDGPEEIVGTLSEDFRIINWDKPFGSPSQHIIAGAAHYGAIVVSGAGTEDANGVYLPINRAELPLDAPEYTSKLMWRHTKNKNLVIVHTEECWWIAHYKDCTRDLYIINDADPLKPPVNSTWTPCTEDDDDSWDVGVAPAPTVTFGLMWAAEPS